ncbi:MAG TPA: hypothetical protein VFN90_10420 [Gemmatimonadales bacterium]|nr:hypothetical protein [Gemmatimonadales bacterium]
MPVTMSIDGTDLATQGIYASGTFRDWLSSPRFRRASVRSPGSAIGSVSAISETEDRVLLVPLRVDGNPASSLSAIRTAEDWLKAKVDSLITFRMADGVNTREIAGYLDRVDLEPMHALPTPAVRCTIEVTCPDVHWKATSQTSVSLNGTPAALAYGTAPVEDWVLVVSGAFTNLTLTLAGQVMTWTGSRTAGQTLTIDAGRGMVYDNTNANQFSGIAGAFPILPAAAATGAITYTSGTPTATLTYYRRYR